MFLNNGFWHWSLLCMPASMQMQTTPLGVQPSIQSGLPFVDESARKPAWLDFLGFGWFRFCLCDHGKSILKIWPRDVELRNDQTIKIKAVQPIMICWIITLVPSQQKVSRLQHGLCVRAPSPHQRFQTTTVDHYIENDAAYHATFEASN